MKIHQFLSCLLFGALPSMLMAQTVYDFDSNNGLNQLTLSSGSTASVATGTFSDNTTNVLNLTSGGQTCVAALNAFTSAADCQVVWKMYYSDLFVTENKAGVVLRSTSRTSTYANGLKTGYYFFLHTNQYGGNSGKVTFRLMKFTTTGNASLASSAATTIAGYTANSPLWLRAKVVGNVLSLDYSINGTTWTSGISYTDVANSFPNPGTAQAVWGLGAVMNNICYMDNMTLTNLDLAKISIQGNNKFVYNGTPQGPANATTSRFSGTPVITYTYQGIGATTYASSTTKPTDEGTYLLTASATDGVSNASDQLAFDILPPFSSYIFTEDAVNSTPANMTFVNNKRGSAIVESYATGTSNGYKTVAKMFKPNTGGANNATYVADLNSITTSTNYSITWKQYITANGQKRGFLLCAQNATTADGGTSTDTSNYAVGLKKGYLFLVYDNGTTNTEMRIYKSVYNAITNLYVVNNKAVPAAATIGAARWYRASIAPNSQKFEYSNDGKTWILASEATDATFQPIAGMKIQAAGGLGGFANCVYYDYIGYTDNTAAPKVQLNGTAVYAYNGTAQTPLAVATGFTSPVITYSYTGSGSTSYGPTAVAPTASGTYVVTANANDGTNNVTSNAFTYTISKATPSLSLSGTSSLTYTGTAQNPTTVSYNGDGATTITYTSTDGAEYNSTTAPSNCGAYQALANSAAGTFYNSATSNYFLFAVNPKTVSIDGVVAANKVFNGTNVASLASTGSYTGLVNGETFAVAGTPVATFADATIGNGKSVTVTGFTAPSTNYLLSGQPTGLTANIFPLVSAFSKAGSSNWSSASEWTYAPIAGTELEIRSGELVVDQNATVKTIRVFPGAKLTLNNGQTLTATDTLMLQGDAVGNGTFVNKGGTLTTSSAKVSQYVTGGRNWYVSSPVSNATSSVFNAVANKLYSFDEVTNAWSQISDNASALTAMKGYVANLSVNGPITFKGMLNDGNQSIALTKTAGVNEGFNLVGNPYPSYLDWSAAATANPNVLSSIWYRTRTVGNAYVFDTYNATGDIASSNGATKITKMVPPMQAFWVHAETATNLQLTNDMRAHGDLAANKLKYSSNKEIVRLRVSEGEVYDETVLYTNNQAINGLDAFDSPKMFANDKAELYTMAGNEKLVINGLAEFGKDMEIPVIFQTPTAGSFSLSLGELGTLSSDKRICLKDKALNKFTDLSEGESYHFTSVATTGTDRFSLVIKSADAVTGLNASDVLNAVSVIAVGNRQIEVRCASLATISIYNGMGQMIASRVVNGGTNTIEVAPQSGILLVSVHVDGKSTTRKVVLN